MPKREGGAPGTLPDAWSWTSLCAKSDALKAAAMQTDRGDRRGMTGMRGAAAVCLRMCVASVCMARDVSSVVDQCAKPNDTEMYK